MKEIDRLQAQNQRMRELLDAAHRTLVDLHDHFPEIDSSAWGDDGRLIEEIEQALDEYLNT